jgi:hypothetical protein
MLARTVPARHAGASARAIDANARRSRRHATGRRMPWQHCRSAARDRRSARASTRKTAKSASETAHGCPDDWALAISHMRKHMPGVRIEPTHQGDIVMQLRQMIGACAVASAVLLGAAGAAFAQSHQGGYLGLNPGAGLTSAGAIQPEHSSGQGGYLGLNPGAGLTAAGPATPEHGSGEGGYLGLIPGANPGALNNRG